MNQNKQDENLVKTQEDVVGDELIGGTVATPEQNIIDELAADVGIERADKMSLNVKSMLDERDENRWELDPESAEDYQKDLT